MMVTAGSPSGLMSACLAAVHRYHAVSEAQTMAALPAAVAPPGGSTALPDGTRAGASQAAAVVSPLSGVLAQQAYQAARQG